MSSPWGGFGVGEVVFGEDNGVEVVFLKVFHKVVKLRLGESANVDESKCTVGVWFGGFIACRGGFGGC